MVHSECVRLSGCVNLHGRNNLLVRQHLRYEYSIQVHGCHACSHPWATYVRAQHGCTSLQKRKNKDAKRLEQRLVLWSGTVRVESKRSSDFVMR